jgi:hypothetical protein
MGENAAKWLQMYKLKHGLGSWPVLGAAIEEKFGVYDYHSSLQDLLQLKREGSVEEYAKSF